MLTFFEVKGANAGADTLLARHVELMRASSPEESCHVMTSDELRASGARVFAGQDETGEVLAIGALKPIGCGEAELKSMHCHDRLRGQGAGRALLDHLVAEARAQGIRALWLETGSDDLFRPARTLYESAGFLECPPFGDYVADPLSVFMRCSL